MLVTERDRGALRIICNGKLLPDPVAGVPEVDGRGPGGLLDVAVHPEFDANRLIYLSYSGRGDGGSGTEVLRAELKDGKLENSEVISLARMRHGWRLIPMVTAIRKG